MNTNIAELLEKSYTAYQAVENAESILKENGFEKLVEQEEWKLVKGGKYYVVRNGSSIIAFKTNVTDKLYFKLVCSHTDSPCLKLKENPEMDGPYVKLNVETYGGGIWYTFFDRELKIAGRIVTRRENKIVSKNVVSDFSVTIPSLAVHMNRGVNDGFAPNAQTDLLPVAGFEKGKLFSSLSSDEIIAHDLYAVPAEKPFYSGIDGELLSSPRIDNLTSVFSSITSLIDSDGDGVTLACAFDNEEVGSQTLQGAGGDFLIVTLRRIGAALGYDCDQTERSFSKSFSISLDNAHALHPNHGEKCDPTNRPVLGEGVVIKGHANKAYCTDARSSAFIKTVFEKSGTAYQLFFNRSDMRSGGTLGSISLSQAGILTADLGLAQLAMHSAVECIAAKDYDNLLKGLSAYYSSSFDLSEDEITFGN